MASSVTLKEARENLDELLERAERGEEIVIERDGRVGIRIVPVAEGRIRGNNLLNPAKGKLWFADDSDPPEANAEIADLFENPVLLPSVAVQ